MERGRNREEKRERVIERQGETGLMTDGAMVTQKQKGKN